MAVGRTLVLRSWAMAMCRAGWCGPAWLSSPGWGQPGSLRALGILGQANLGPWCVRGWPLPSRNSAGNHPLFQPRLPGTSCSHPSALIRVVWGHHGLRGRVELESQH